VEKQMDPQPTDTTPAQPVTGIDDLLPDELHLPFAHLLSELADVEEHVRSLDEAEALSIEQIRLDLPVEFLVQVDSNGKLRVLGSPPTQRTETTFLPVFHRMVLCVTRDGADDG
jgi:hypothetical protein